MIEVEEQYKEKLTPERIAEDLDFSVPVYLVGYFVLLAILFPAIVLIFQTILSVRPGLFPLGRAVRILLLAEAALFCLSAAATILLHRAIRTKKFRVEVGEDFIVVRYPYTKKIAMSYSTVVFTYSPES